MSIRIKLISIFSLLVALIIALGAFVLLQMHAINREVESLVQATLPALSEAVALKEALTRYQAEQLAIARDPAQLAEQATRTRLTALEARLNEQFAHYRALETSAQQREALATLEVRWKAYLDVFGVAALERLTSDAACRAHLEASHSAHEQLIAASAALNNVSRARADEALTTVVAAHDTARSVTIATLTILVMFGTTVGFSQALDISDGLRNLRRATRRAADGDLQQQVVIESGDELEALAGDFRALMASLRAERDAVRTQQQALHARNADLERANAELQAVMQERAELSATVRSLAAPVLPVHAGVLVIPLVGVFDVERTALLHATLLTEVERTGAHMLIVDVTGLAVCDQQLATVLVQTATAVRMLGARMIMVGIRPELAQLLVTLGLSLDSLITRADLQSGVQYAMRP